jgi:hypothetical protein
LDCGAGLVADSDGEDVVHGPSEVYTREDDIHLEEK